MRLVAWLEDHPWACATLLVAMLLFGDAVLAHREAVTTDRVIKIPLPPCESCVRPPGPRQYNAGNAKPNIWWRQGYTCSRPCLD